MRARRYPIFAADVRRIGGIVSVHTARERYDGTPIFRVGHISAGGDVAFLSMSMMLEDHAAAAARVLAEFVGGALAGEISPERTLAKFPRGGEMPLANPKR
jgi:hypothetical protein